MAIGRTSTGTNLERALCPFLMATSVLAQVTTRQLRTSRHVGTARDRVLGDLRALAGVSRFPVRIKCALLGWNALEEALKLSAP